MIPTKTQLLLETLRDAVKQNSIYLVGEYLLSVVFEQSLPSIMDFVVVGDNLQVDSIYKKLSSIRTVNREIEHTDDNWRIVSEDLILNFSRISAEDWKKRLSSILVSTDQLAYDLSTTQLPSPPASIAMVQPKASWTTADILQYALALSMTGLAKSADFEGVLLNKLPQKQTDILSSIVLSRQPGIAFSFLVETFDDGRQWLSNQLLKLAQVLDIPIDESISSEELVGQKKCDLLNIYGQFFAADTTQESASKSVVRLNTNLRLIFNSPNLNIGLPYIEKAVFLPTTSSNASAFTKLDIPLPPYIEVCDPRECGEKYPDTPCCCCQPESIISQVAVRCNEKVIISCNKDGSGPGPGLEPEFPEQCDQCREVCEGILTESTYCANLPQQPWWHYDKTWTEVCQCNCALHEGPGDEGACLLTCATCGKLCYSEFEVYPSSLGDCYFSAKARPSQSCCGNPGLIDVLFVIDVSGSMGDNINNVKNSIHTMVEKAVQQGTEIRLGLTVFGGCDDSAKWKLLLPFTTDVDMFRDTLDAISVCGGTEYDLEATIYGVQHSAWLAADKYVILIGDESTQVQDGSIDSVLVETVSTCKTNQIVVYTVTQGSTHRPLLAQQTGGSSYDLSLPFSQIFDDMRITAFPAACECLSFDYVPILYSAAGDTVQNCVDAETNLPVIDPATGEPPERCTAIPIHVCNIDENCDEKCSLEHNLWACGISITIDPLKVNQLCCSEVGYGCKCNPTPPDGQCCGPDDQCDPVCDPVTKFPLYNSLEEAQEATWCKCFDKAVEFLPENCTSCCCPDVNLPIGHRWYPCWMLQNIQPGDELYTQAQELLQNHQCCPTSPEQEDACCHLCVMVPDGNGGTTKYCKEEIDLAVAAAFPNCRRKELPEFECPDEILNTVDCIVPIINSENPCSEPRAGSGSVYHPSTTVLNNGIGLVAYEVHEGEQPYSSIRIEQFKTSLLAKVLPNRVFNFGRLQHQSRWANTSNGTFVAKLYYYDDTPSGLISVQTKRSTILTDGSKVYELQNDSDVSAEEIGLAPAGISAFAFDKNDILYAIDLRPGFNFKLYQVTLSPFAFTEIGELSGIDYPTTLGSGITGMCFDPQTDDKVWITLGNSVYYFYLSTRICHSYCSHETNDLRGIGFDATGTMYTSRYYNSNGYKTKLVVVNTDATLTERTDISTGMLRIYSAGGAIYGCTTAGQVYSFNKTNGQSTLITTITGLDTPITAIVSRVDVDLDSTENDTISFRSGPLRGKCFPLSVNNDGEILGTDDTGTYIPFVVPVGITLSEQYPSTDDVYNIEWFIMNKQDSGLIGDAVDGESLFDIPGSSVVNGTLKSILHKHNGNPVPVANPSIACTKNYMNAYENSHFVYLVYQAMEDEKWNVYLRQIRLSEYEHDSQILNANAATMVDVNEIIVDEYLYRVVCTSDQTSPVGNNIVATRTSVVEVLMSDGRDVLTKFSSGNWGQLCGDYPADTFPRRKVFAKITHAAVTDAIPDIFDMDAIFPNWRVGDEYRCSGDVVSSDQLFGCMKGDSVPIGVYDIPITVEKVFVSSSYFSVSWYQDISIDSWYVMSDDDIATLTKYKGFDVCEPILLSNNAEHCMNPVVGVNYNNNVFVAYEKVVSGVPCIELVGTSTPSTSLPIGVINQKNLDNQLDYFLTPSDFTYRQVIANLNVNQSPSMHIDRNDVVHISWQSNQNADWEIYYAKSENEFANQRITRSPGKSLNPRISGNDDGDLYIVWHDTRFGNYEIMLAYNASTRTIPYSQQDAYWAGARNGYTHYEDVVTVNLTNSKTYSQCFDDIRVVFCYDRNLSQAAFTIGYKEYPFAFTFDGDTGTNILSLIDINLWQTVGDTLVSPEFDTTIPLSEISRFKVNGCPVSISFRSSDMPLDSAADGQWTGWNDVNADTWYSLDDPYLSIPYFPSTAGRYMQIRIICGPCGIPSSIDIETYRPLSVCVPAGETIVAYLDLTPDMSVDTSGSQIPVPISALFRTNNTYFIRAYGVGDDGEFYYFEPQSSTVSCLTCTRSAQSYETNSCSLLLQYTNNSSESITADFVLEFNSDVVLENPQLTLTTSGDPEYFGLEDGRSISDIRESDGFRILPYRTLNIIVTPPLSESASVESELLCGIKYGVRISLVANGQTTPLSKKIWSCDCGSPRWSGTPVSSLDALSRWYSSANGYSDIRLTETRSNNYNPVLRMKDNYHGIVLYESDRQVHTTDTKKEFNEIYASVFKFLPDYSTFATGSQAIVAPKTGSISRTDIRMSVPTKQTFIAGNNLDFCLDQYDNMFIAVEEPGSPLLENPIPTGPVDLDAFKRQRIIKVYRLDFDHLDFETEFVDPTAINSGTTSGDQTDTCIERLTCYPDTGFAQSQLVKQIRVKNDAVRYHVTRQTRVVPVVKSCSVEFVVVGTPETIAVRLRNSVQDDWSSWFTFASEVSTNTIEVKWSLSKGCGLKNVYFQFVTYTGLTAGTKYELIADYDQFSYALYIYKAVRGIDETLMTDSSVFASTMKDPTIFADENKTKLFNAMPVASLEVVAADGTQPDHSYVFIEIVPSKTLSSELTFDFIQQGPNDFFNLPTLNVNGAYRGAIRIEKEDMVNYKDGLAIIVPHFDKDCYTPIVDNASQGSGLQYNTMSSTPDIEPKVLSDPWTEERDQFGRIQHKVTIRPNDDPHFVFGDPDYRLVSDNDEH